MHVLPQLSYSYDALEPYFDALTMETHYSKHHQTYVDKFNAALESFPDLQNLSPEQLLSQLNELKVDDKAKTALRNHGGGHANHSLFWQLLIPAGDQVFSDKLQQLLVDHFGSVETFKTKFSEAALGQFGSGWAWLVVTPEKKLEIYSLPNQDSPLSKGQTPVLCLDVWEHAYYLKYQNRRADYVEAFWSVINWTEVENRLTKALG
ncbi:MAG: superoxide dismutase [Patescibacteria group bacterium]